MMNRSKNSHEAKISCLDKPPRQIAQRILVLTVAVLATLVIATRVLVPLMGGQRVASKVYVVARGDTLVSIAEAADPHANPYPIVARLEEQTHGSLVRPGERIVVPILSH
jgi:hypothetical protein